jgi:hypothetical protein
MMVGRLAGGRRAQQDGAVGMQGRASRGRRRAGAMAVVLGLLAPMLAVSSAVPAGAGINGCNLDAVTVAMNGGDAPGSVGNPYVIAIPADLDGIEGCDSPGYFFRQTAHLDLTGTTYTSAVIAGTFQGFYDGGGFEIRGLRIVAPSSETDPVGLFETIDGADVRGIRLVGPRVTAQTSLVGALAGSAVGSTILDVEVLPGAEDGFVAVTGDHGVIGGLVGLLFDSSLAAVRVMSLTVSLTGLSGTAADEQGGTGGMGGVGGVVGLADKSSLFQVEFEGAVTSESDEVGGIAGSSASSELIGVRADGVISATGALVGGLVGAAYDVVDEREGLSASSISVGSFSGTVNGREVVGGAVGSLEGGFLELVQVAGTVSAVDGYVGGIVGSVSSALVYRSAFTGTVSTTGPGEDTAFTGGIAGDLSGGIVIESSVEGSVTSTGQQTGGIAGQLRGGVILDSSSRVTLRGEGQDLGGVAGILVALAGPEVSCAGDPFDLDMFSGDFVWVARTWSSATDQIGTAVPLAGRAIVPLGGAADCLNVDDSFWESAAAVVSIAGTPRTATQMSSIATYTDTSDAALRDAWPIVAGVVEPTASGVLREEGDIWGICAGAFGGYPFLLWRVEGSTEEEVCSGDASDVVAPVTSAGSGPALSCTTLPATVGAVVTCTITGGPVGGDILWRAAYNPVFAEGVVIFGEDARGTFSFRVPAAALGQPLTVELVDWSAPAPLGVVSGPVPGSVPAGDGPASGAPLGFPATFALLLALVVGMAVARRTVSGRYPSPGWYAVS